jgi:sugar lactone lactonase YvrE
MQDIQRVYALDAATGGELWHFDVDGGNQGSVALADGMLFVPTMSGTLYAVQGDGTDVTVAPPPQITMAPEPTPEATASQSSEPSSSPTESSSATAGLPVRRVWTIDEKALGVDGNQMTLAPDGKLWVSDPYHDRFAIFEPDGTFDGTWGTSGSAPGQFDLTRSNGDGYGAIAFEPDGSFFVLDCGNRRIQLFDAERHFVKTFGEFGGGPGQFLDPVGIVVGADDDVHVLEDANGVIENYASDGTRLGSFKAFVNAQPGFNAANALALDSSGSFYISDIQPYQVEMLDGSGNLVRTFGSPGNGAGRFSDQPGFMAVDADGRLFVDGGADAASGDDTFQVFDAAGKYLAGWGGATSGNLRAMWPTGIVLDGQGGLYFADHDLLTISRLALQPPFGPG